MLLITGGMLWLGIWLGAAGITCVSRLWPYLTAAEVAAIAIPTGIIGGAWISYILGCLASTLGTVAIGGSLVVACVVARIAWSRYIAIASQYKSALLAEIASDIGLKICLGLAFATFPLWWTRYFPEDTDGNVHSGGSVWADGPIHLHIAHSFMYGRNQEVSFTGLQNPIMADRPMVYPFLPDWHAAVMATAGSTMRETMMITGMLMCISFFVLLYRFGRRIVRSQAAAVLGVVMLICAGGQGGIRLLSEVGWEQLMIEYDPIQDDVGAKGQVFWFAFMPHVYFPQRGATFAYPAVLAAFICVWAATSPERAMPDIARKRLIMTAALFAAALPLVQAHSFIALGVIMAVVFLFQAPRWLSSPAQLSAWLSAGVVAVVLAVPQLAGFLNTVEAGGPNGPGSFMAFRPIWKPPAFDYAASFVNYIWFWWRGLGPAVPAAMIALAALAARVVPLCIAAARQAWTARHVLPGQSRVAPPTAGAGDAATGLAHAPDLWAYDDLDDAVETVAGEVLGKPARKRGAKLVLPQADPITNMFGGGLQFPASAVDSSSYLLAVVRQLEPLPSMSAQAVAVLDAQDPARVLDTFAWACAGMAAWWFGNLVILQPWDRDNCKLLYIAMFISTHTMGWLFLWPWTQLAEAGPAMSRAVRAWLKGEDRPAAGPTSHIPPEATAALSRDGDVLPPVVPAALVRASVLSLGWRVASVLVTVWALYHGAGSGALSLAREWRLYHVLYDNDARAVGEYMRAHVNPKAVVATGDTHLSPAGYYAGMPSLVGYSGWAWSHGLDTQWNDRRRDINVILSHMMQDSDPNVYEMCRRWGIRYVLGENPQPWQRDPEKERNAPDDFLDGKLKRVFQAGRYHLMEVQGYDHPPA